MFFHYGNCKKEIQDLKQRNVNLESVIQEGRAMYDYQLAVLEKEIEQLESDIGSRKCVSEGLEQEIKLLNEEINCLSREKKILEISESITNPKPISKINSRPKKR